MAKYIDKEELLEFIRVDLANFYPSTFLNGILVVARDIEKKITPVDAIPRDEHLFELRQAKQEVARELFEEIETKIKLNLDFYSHHTTILDNVRAKVDAFSEIDDFLAELKKKYIGE